MGAAPAELVRLRERLADGAGLKNALRVLFWDQNTYMPPNGAATRAEALATLEGLLHRCYAEPEVGRLLDALEPYADSLDPDDDARLEIAAVRRDFEKAVRVPEALLTDIARAGAMGQQAWHQARAAGEYRLFRDALAQHIDLRHRYAACFPEVAHPYDALVDDFEPEMTVAVLRPLFAELAAELTPLVAAAQDGEAEAFPDAIPVEQQAAALREVLLAVGFTDDSWRLDLTVHPFAQSPGPGDYRITTAYREHDFAFALYSGLHEFGHALYEAGLGDDPRGGILQEAVSLGVHESQSRLWENMVGRGRAFCGWVAPLLARHLPVAPDADRLFRALNVVRPSLIRFEADETTYNLHVALRFELEMALLEGTLSVDDVPDAWDAGMHRLLGVEVPDVGRGVLQDVHWGAGLIGYFPTYTLGNLLAAQLWDRMRADLPDLEDGFARGEFAPLREWLRTNVHAHGRRHLPRELTRRVTGQELSARPFLDYLASKLADAGVVGTAGAGGPPGATSTPPSEPPPAGATPAAA